MNLMKPIFIWALILFLSACDDHNSISLVEHNRQISEKDVQIKQLNEGYKELNQKFADLTAKEKLVTEELKEKKRLLDDKNAVERRMWEWNNDNWYWVNACSKPWFGAILFPWCGYSDKEFEIAKKRDGQGYSRDPASIILYIPVVLLYFFSSFFVCLYALYWLIKSILKKLAPFAAAVRFKYSLSYRMELRNKYKNKIASHKARLREKIEEAEAKLLEAEKKLAEADAHRYDVDIATTESSLRNWALQGDIEKANEEIEIIKNEKQNLINNCIHDFTNRANSEKEYLDKIRQFLNNPISRDFEKFSGLSPTPETLKILKEQ